MERMRASSSGVGWYSPGRCDLDAEWIGRNEDVGDGYADVRVWEGTYAAGVEDDAAGAEDVEAWLLGL